MLSENQLQSKLETIRDIHVDSIKACVIDEALDSDDIQNFFEELLRYGCSSGMIGSLIYYADTHKFYDAYYSEIEDIRLQIESEMGEPLKIEGDLKNTLVWTAFEWEAYNLASELGLT